MKLKAIILATGLINCIAFSAQAVDSTITVTGNVLQRTCTTSDITVSLGNMYTSDFSNNSASVWKDAIINLTGCQNVSSVKAVFSGVVDDVNAEYFKNTATGAASGLAVQLSDKDAPTAVYKNNSVKTVSVTGGVAHFNMQVRAIKTGSTVTSGAIQSVITVTYTYS